MALALISVLMISIARFSVPIMTERGQELPGWLPYLVSAVLGFTFPLVSAGFFIRGSDVLGNRFRLWRLSRDVRQLAQKAADARNVTADLVSQLTLLRDRKTRHASKDFLHTELQVRKAEFDAGYRDGILKLFTATEGETIYDKLKPIVLRKLLSGR